MGTPLLEDENEVSWFLGFWFVGFLVSKCLGFKQGFPITKIPFRISKKIFIPYSSFSRNVKTDLQDLPAPAFSKQNKISIFIMIFENILSFKCCSDFS